jgi:hypothetical protein
MSAYPAEEIDRIIAEEVCRGEEASKWYGPVARARITMLFMERLCGAWHKQSVRDALKALAIAEQKLLYYCTDKEVVWCFSDGGAYQMLGRILDSYTVGLSMALTAADEWPIESSFGSHEDRKNVLEIFQEHTATVRARGEAEFRAEGRVSIQASEFVEMYLNLQAIYCVFLTSIELQVFLEQMAMAIEQLGGAQILFFPPPGGPAKA